MLSIGFLTLDIIILIAIFVALFAWSLYSGKKVLARFILIFYPATLIFQNFPYISLDTAILKVAAYLLIFIVLYFFLRKNATSKKLYTGGRKMFDGIILSLSGLIIILNVYYHVLPVGELYTFTLPFSKLFTTVLPLGIWYLIPLIGIIATNKDDR